MLIEIFADGIDRVHIHRDSLHVGCRAVIVQDGKILGEFLENDDVFNLPGGTLELGETLEECCIREVAEETGVQITDLQPRCIIREYFPDATWESHYFTAKPVEGTTISIRLTSEESDAGLKCRWYDLYDFLGFLESYPSRHPYGANIHQRELIGMLNSL